VVYKLPTGLSGFRRGHGVVELRGCFTCFTALLLYLSLLAIFFSLFPFILHFFFFFVHFFSHFSSSVFFLQKVCFLLPVFFFSFFTLQTAFAFMLFKVIGRHYDTMTRFYFSLGFS
jgi:hypothetical protein